MTSPPLRPSPGVARVVYLLFPGFAPLDVAGPAQAFSAAASEAYGQTLLSLDGGLVESDCPGLRFDSRPAAGHTAAIQTLLLPGGMGVFAACREPRLIAEVRGLAARAERVASVCVGAWLAAEAGLLDGRRATTHWRASALFRTQYPRVRLDADAIFVRDDRVWSSAGISAGMDLALALIEQDLGQAAATRVARELVMPLRRQGGQSQFSTLLEIQSLAGGAFAETLAWIGDNLGADLRVGRLAERSHMSERTFSRRFGHATGTSVTKAIEKIRVEAACTLLAGGASPVRAARACGFASEQRMRRAFLRQLKLTPSDWQRRFGPAAGGDDAGRN